MATIRSRAAGVGTTRCRVDDQVVSAGYDGASKCPRPNAPTAGTPSAHPTELTISSLWIIVQAFKEHVSWGVAVLVVPLVYVVFSVLNWKYSRRPFLLGLAAGVALFVELLVVKLFNP
ncbi:MAG: hypothetical protein AB1Z98_20815 [Nannocystaceae bacterium]